LSCQKLDKFAISYFYIEIVIVCAVLYFIHIYLGVFINVIFSVFIFIGYIKFALFYGFVQNVWLYMMVVVIWVLVYVDILFFWVMMCI